MSLCEKRLALRNDGERETHRLSCSLCAANDAIRGALAVEPRPGFETRFWAAFEEERARETGWLVKARSWLEQGLSARGFALAASAAAVAAVVLYTTRLDRSFEEPKDISVAALMADPEAFENLDLAEDLDVLDHPDFDRLVAEAS